MADRWWTIHEEEIVKALQEAEAGTPYLLVMDRLFRESEREDDSD